MASTLTSAQVRDLYNGTLTEIDFAGRVLTHDDVTSTWIGIPIGPGDTHDDGTPADHMWAEIAAALRHEHEPE